MKKIMLISFVLIIISCESKIEVDFNYSEFLTMKRKWEQLKISDYSYTYSSLGFGCISNKFVIENSSVIATNPDTTKCRLRRDSTLRYTIDDIFYIIEFRYKNPIIRKESNESYWYCYKIEIEYDSTYFFPKSYEFKQKGKNMDITDTESIQSITDFRIK